MAISVANSWSAHGSNVQNLGVAVSGVQAGELLVVACFLFDSAAKHFDAPTDDAGNTYTLLSPVVWDATNRSICVFAYAKNVAVSGLTTVTAHVNNTTANDVEIFVYRVSGADTTAPFDAEATPTKQTAQNPTTGALTTTNASDLIFLAYAQDGASVTPTAPTGFTLGKVDNPNGYASAYQAVSSVQTAQTYQWSTTGSRDYSMVVGAFKAASTNLVAFDAASSSAYQASVSTYNWSHSCAGSNRVLLVGVSVFAAGSVTGITYNGVALTKIRARTNGLYRSELWYLTAPATGANSIAVTLSASLTSIGSAASYANVNQLSPIAVSTDAVGTGNPATASLTTLTDNEWTADVISTSDAAITVGAGQTSRANNNGALGSGAMSDKGPITPAGSASMSWTAIGVADTWAYIIASLDPVADAPVYNVTLPDADTEICANDLVVSSYHAGGFNAKRLLLGVGV